MNTDLCETGKSIFPIDIGMKVTFDDIIFFLKNFVQQSLTILLVSIVFHTIILVLIKLFNFCSFQSKTCYQGLKKINNSSEETCQT